MNKAPGLTDGLACASDAAPRACRACGRWRPGVAGVTSGSAAGSTGRATGGAAPRSVAGVGAFVGSGRTTCR
jgi:hypothetical protein